jgi:4-aminobutyrate aminotransferase-like enzyme
MAQKHNCIAEVRGLGAMVAMELCKTATRTSPMPT